MCVLQKCSAAVHRDVVQHCVHVACDRSMRHCISVVCASLMFKQLLINCNSDVRMLILDSDAAVATVHHY
jgi:hypothetical protein